MVDDLAQWLEGLGLGQYAQAFVDNSIDFELLPDLAEDDLKELGLNIGRSPDGHNVEAERSGSLAVTAARRFLASSIRPIWPSTDAWIT